MILRDSATSGEAGRYNSLEDTETRDELAFLNSWKPLLGSFEHGSRRRPALARRNPQLQRSQPAFGLEILERRAVATGDNDEALPAAADPEP